LRELLKEVERREAVKPDQFYPGAGDGATFETEAGELSERREHLVEDRQNLTLLLSTLEETLGQLENEDLPAKKPLKEWLAQINAFKANLEKGKKFADDLDKAIEKGGERLAGLREQYQKVLKAVVSPALQDERFNFPPLHKGETLLFRVSRGSKPEGKDLTPGRSNELELRTVPVFTARFGTGLVFSELEDPVFEFDGTNAIRFRDEGNGEVRLGLFVHHYWGRRSTGLKATLFEKFMPTVSLGIPVSEGKGIFDEVFLGLDWELATGVDLVAGLHFAKVNALVDESQLNQVQTAPAGGTLDIADFQKETSKSRLFFGVVLNSDIFKLFQNGGNSSE
jgi:hypothetical protein